MHKTRNRSKLYPTPVLFVLRCNLEPVSNDDGDRAVCEHCLHRGSSLLRAGAGRPHGPRPHEPTSARKHTHSSVCRARAGDTPLPSDDSTIATPDSGERPLAARASKSVELRPPRRSRSCRGQRSASNLSLRRIAVLHLCRLSRCSRALLSSSGYRSGKASHRHDRPVAAPCLGSHRCTASACPERKRAAARRDVVDVQVHEVDVVGEVRRQPGHSYLVVPDRHVARLDPKAHSLSVGRCVFTTCGVWYANRSAHGSVSP
jgi:hypothetical protein